MYGRILKIRYGDTEFTHAGHIQKLVVSMDV